MYNVIIKKYFYLPFLVFKKEETKNCKNKRFIIIHNLYTCVYIFEKEHYN